MMSSDQAINRVLELKNGAIKPMDTLEDKRNI